MSRTLDPAKLCPLGRQLVALAARHGHPNLHAAARASGIAYSQLYDIAVGAKSPNAKTLERIVEQLGGTMGGLYAEPTTPTRD